MTTVDLERQIKELNNKISELALIVSLKTKEMDETEKIYTERLEILNDYFSKIRTKLDLSNEESGKINDVDFIAKLQTMNLSEENNDFILIPAKNIVITPTDKQFKNNRGDLNKNEQISNQPYTFEKESGKNRRKKISCSYCNEKGHKRAQCPRILYNQ